MIFLCLDGRVHGPVFNSALIDSGFHEDVAFVCPSGSPAVANDPVFGSILVTVTNNGDGVVEAGRTIPAEDARPVDCENSVIEKYIHCQADHHGIRLVEANVSTATHLKPDQSLLASKVTDTGLAVVSTSFIAAVALAPRGMIV